MKTIHNSLTAQFIRQAANAIAMGYGPRRFVDWAAGYWGETPDEQLDKEPNEGDRSFSHFDLEDVDFGDSPEAAAVRYAEVEAALAQLKVMKRNLEKILKPHLAAGPIAYKPVVVSGISVITEHENGGKPKELVLNGGFSKTTTTHAYPIVPVVARALEAGVSEDDLAGVFDEKPVLFTRVDDHKSEGEPAIEDARETALYRLANGDASFRNRLNALRETAEKKAKRADGVRSRKAEEAK